MRKEIEALLKSDISAYKIENLTLAIAKRLSDYYESVTNKERE